MLTVFITDKKVENAGQGVGGGLAAHNYWDNVAQFIDPLAKLLMSVANL